MRGCVGLSPPVKYFTDRSKAVLGSFMFFSAWCLLCLCTRPFYMCLVVTCCERAGFLALVCGVLLSHRYPGSGVVLDCIDS